MSEELQDIFSELAIKGWGEDVDKIIQEIERLNKELEEKEAILGGIQQLEAEILGGIQQLEAEIERLNKKIEQYENPEDMTLMFMWCDEKAKDEIKRLNNIINLIKNNIDITIQIIKEQPTGNDEWILERLNGIKNIGELKGSDKE